MANLWDVDHYWCQVFNIHYIAYAYETWFCLTKGAAQGFALGYG